MSRTRAKKPTSASDAMVEGTRIEGDPPEPASELVLPEPPTAEPALGSEGPKPPVKAERIQTSVILPAALHRAFMAASRVTGTSLSEVVVEALTRWVAAHREAVQRYAKELAESVKE